LRKLVFIGASIAAIAVTAILLAREAIKRPSDDSLNVEVVRAARRDMESVVKATGAIKPMVGAEVRVGSSASGVVTHLFVRIGDTVQKGQVLAEIDSRELLARRDAGEAAVRVAKANLEYARADLQRKQDLSAAQVIARSELDLAVQAHNVAEQQHNQAQANLADAMTLLSYARIVAPIGGIVESVSTQEGETVASSFAAPTFVTLLDLTRLEVWAYVDETDIGRIKFGQKAGFTVDTYPGHKFEGRVIAIHPQAEIRDNVVDYVTVLSFKPTRDYILRPEMTATVKIAVEQHKNVLALPVRAVRRESGQQFVLVRNGSRIARKWITTGIRNQTYAEIVEGLGEGAEVVVGEIIPDREANP